MATIEQLSTALRNADAAGDTDAARRLASAIREMHAAPAEDPRNSLLGKADTFMRGAADTLSFGLADELSAGMGALTGIGGKFGDYSGNLAAQRGMDASDADQRAGYRLAGQLGGGVTGGIGLVKNGLSLAGRAAEAGQGLGRIAMGSAADGAVLGAMQGAGSGEGVEGRAFNSGAGLIAGGVLGAGTPYAVTTASAVGKPVLAAAMARFRPESYANAALGEGMRRAGSDPQKVMAALADARADNQPVYTVADALGLSGQRMASSVARVPHESRQEFVEALNARQAGQGRRITNALSEAFDAPDTAAARTAALTDARAAEANQLYGEARKLATPVDVSPAVKAIDDVLLPGVHAIARPNNQIAHDSIEGALSRVRSMITDGKSNLTDFNAVFRAKLDLDDMITKAENQGAGNRAHYLGNIQNKLDQTLADASPAYAKARDAFATASKRIEAVDAGKKAAMRGRSEDTVAVFNAMTPEEQAAFRAGYADPLIAHAQGAAVGSDKSRPLISDATGREFATIPADGKGSRLWNQLGREKQMFETRNAATGGSKTADNLADMADMTQFDPSIMGSLLQGKLLPAASMAIAKALNETKGLPPSVMSRVAKALMETDPNAARMALEAAAKKSGKSIAHRSSATAIINALGSAGGGRLALP
jgi:hypothetical protein